MIKKANQYCVISNNLLRTYLEPGGWWRWRYLSSSVHDGLFLQKFNSKDASGPKSFRMIRSIEKHWSSDCVNILSFPPGREALAHGLQAASTPQILTSSLAAAARPVRRRVCVFVCLCVCVLRVGRGVRWEREEEGVAWICVSTSFKIKSLMTLASPIAP